MLWSEERAHVKWVSRRLKMKRNSIWTLTIPHAMLHHAAQCNTVMRYVIKLNWAKVKQVYITSVHFIETMYKQVKSVSIWVFHITEPCGPWVCVPTHSQQYTVETPGQHWCRAVKRAAETITHIALLRGNVLLPIALHCYNNFFRSISNRFWLLMNLSILCTNIHKQFEQHFIKNCFLSIHFRFLLG